MSERYLLVFDIAGAGAASRAQVLAERTGLDIALAEPAFALLVDQGTRWLALDGHGALVGALFHRHGPPRPIDELETGEVERLVSTWPDVLLKDFWGGYVALRTGPRGCELLRDPSGALPCYLARAGVGLAASDVETLLATGLVKTRLDWAALARHLYHAGLPVQRTVLAGIEELLAGAAVDPVDPQRAVRFCWSPWDHVAATESLAPGEARERLARLVRHCVRAWTRPYRHLLLSVSGGLDSSIVAACLARGDRPALTCLTMYGDDPGGDERPYARALCARLGLGLVERRYRVEDVDLAAPLGAHLPRPFGRSQADAYERAHLEAARATGADAFVTGNGGDNVFGYSQSAAAIVDRWRCEGLSAALVRTIADVCHQTGCSAVAALRAAWRLLHAPAGYGWRPGPAFLHPDVIADQAMRPLYHPWLDAPMGALPGKAAHIAALLRVQANLCPRRISYAPVLNPLLSQPIVEFCLAVPSWRWRAGGFDRALARDAFRDVLPQEIATRRSKGGPDGFTARLVDHHRTWIGDRLLDGRLAAQRLIDVDAIARLLADTRPTLGEDRARLLELVATEAWLDHWAGCLEAINARQQLAS